MVIDIHAHALPEEFVRETASRWPGRLEIRRIGGRERLVVDGRVLTSVVRPFTMVEAILETQAAAGVQITVLSPWVELLLGVDATTEEWIFPCLNEAMARWAQRHPDRLRILGAVPLHDPRRAAQALEALMREPGIVGVEVPAQVRGELLGGDQFEPFWEVAEATRALVFIHPTGRGAASHALEEYYLWNAVGNPLETALTASHLIMAGVLERHPRLKILLAHGGGTLLCLKGRLGRAWQQRPEARRRLREPPEESLRRLYFDTVTHDPELLRAVVAFAGADHVLLGSDAPFDMGLEEPVSFVRTLGFPSEVESAILGRNAARLIGLEE
jgi:aminocarboxymuconate-semialdehyde decarboxylase